MRENTIPRSLVELIKSFQRYSANSTLALKDK